MNECVSVYVYMQKFSPILPMCVSFVKIEFLVCSVTIDPPTTSWRVPHVLGKIFCHNTKYEPLAKFLASENFVVCGTYLTVIGVHEMHGQIHPNYCQITANI